MKHDLWQDRTLGRRCETCMWWVEKVPKKPITKQYSIIGRCRKNAPIVLEGWPPTYPDDWCGAHKMDEEKI